MQRSQVKNNALFCLPVDKKKKKSRCKLCNEMQNIAFHQKCPFLTSFPWVFQMRSTDVPLIPNWDLPNGNENKRKAVTQQA